MEEVTINIEYEQPAKGGERDSTNHFRVGMRVFLSSLYPPPHWQCFQQACSCMLFYQLFPLSLLCWHTHTLLSIIQGFWQLCSEQRMGADVQVQNFASDVRVTPPTDGSLQIGNKWLRMLWNRAAPAISMCSLSVERTRGAGKKAELLRDKGNNVN